MKTRTKALIYAVCIFVLILLQSTVLDYAEILNVKPNLLMIFIVCVALLRGNTEGSMVGLFTGLAHDMLFGRVIGFYALLGMFLGLIIGSLNRKLYKDNILVVTFFTLVSSLVYDGLVYFFNMFGSILDGSADILFAVRNVVLPAAVYNSVVSIVIYALTAKLDKRFEELGKPARKY